MTIAFQLNTVPVESDYPPDTPLLWALREEFSLTATKFGCGIGRCGACTVHVDDQARRACVVPLSAVEGRRVTTLEGLGEHALKRAWLREQVPQCGYCQSGQIMQAAALLRTRPTPTREEVISAMTGNLCRCMAYPRILRAILSAAEEARDA